MWPCGVGKFTRAADSRKPGRGYKARAYRR